jgi:geranylgeranyl reductase family protein
VSATPTEDGDVRADVAIVGAGPAGSVAAFVLARAGLDVVLMDRARFPRDKACGDGLMPDALAALAAIGLADRALAGARRLTALRIYTPNGTPVTVNGEFAVVPRERLDACLCDAAVDAGARLLTPVRAIGPVEQNGRVAGVVGETAGGGSVCVRARTTVLATGAGAGPLTAFGVCEQSRPSGMAARFYVVPEDEGARVDLDALCVSFNRSICPGYGWVFPGPGGSFNIGVGYSTAAPPETKNLRVLMARFVENFPPARELTRMAGRRSDVHGAPLRTGLTGSRLSEPGVLVVGDAAGFTYPITGEGIGKAIESGILAAEIIRDGVRANRSAEAIANAYRDGVEKTFRARFQAYENAQRWLAFPRLLDFLAWRANSGSYVRKQFRALAADIVDPRAILSFGGLIRTLFT